MDSFINHIFYSQTPEGRREISCNSMNKYDFKGLVSDIWKKDNWYQITTPGLAVEFWVKYNNSIVIAKVDFLPTSDKTALANKIYVYDPCSCFNGNKSYINDLPQTPMEIITVCLDAISKVEEVRES